MKLSHSQRATAHHLGMTEDEYLEHDRLIDLGRDTLLQIHTKLAETLTEMDVIGGALGDKRPGRFADKLDEIRDLVAHSLRCGDCGVVPGQLHEAGCDTYRCKQCGWQGWVCGTHTPPENLTTHTGLWPGTVEEREYGLLDLNMLATFHAQNLLVWDSEKERLFRNPHISDAQWSRACDDYVAKEEKMSNDLFSSGWFGS